MRKIELIPEGFPVSLAECPEGPFLYDGDVGFKSEYQGKPETIDAYCLESGEYFWGGTSTGEKQRELIVQPLRIDKS